MIVSSDKTGLLILKFVAEEVEGLETVLNLFFNKYILKLKKMFFLVQFVFKWFYCGLLICGCLYDKIVLRYQQFAILI